MSRLGPTPLTHFSELVHPAAEKLLRTYIRCLGFANPCFDRHLEMARTAPLWSSRELPIGHHPYVMMPGETTQLLLELV